MCSFYSGVQNVISRWLFERDHDHAKKAELSENRIAFEILRALRLSLRVDAKKQQHNNKNRLDTKIKATKPVKN